MPSAYQGYKEKHQTLDTQLDVNMLIYDVPESLYICEYVDIF